MSARRGPALCVPAGGTAAKRIGRARLGSRAVTVRAMYDVSLVPFLLVAAVIIIVVLIAGKPASRRLIAVRVIAPPVARHEPR